MVEQEVERVLLDKRHSEIGCRGQPVVVSEACVEALHCGADVRFCSCSGGHRWPRDAGSRIVEYVQAQSK